MENPFNFYRPVTGKDYIGNEVFCMSMANLLQQGENILLYAPPKSGRKSSIRNSILGLRSRGEMFNTVDFSFLNMRSAAKAFGELGSAMMHSSGLPLDTDLAASLLEGSSWETDPDGFSGNGCFLYHESGENLDMNDVDAIMSLPLRMTLRGARKMIITLDEFQNILFWDNAWDILKMMEDCISRLNGNPTKGGSYIFTGSRFNAMREIFDVKKFFFRKLEKMELPPIEAKEITEHITKAFLTSGKVIDKELLFGVCHLFRCNMWYINHLSSICNSFSKGYIMEPVLEEALEAIISMNQPRFESTVNDLTNFQVSLLRAIANGESRLSSSETIRKYDLHSSANVARLKEALCKKEIVTPGKGEEFLFLDPLFEYWVKKHYFKITEQK